MSFKDSTLEFSSTQILDSESGIEVMMDWEDAIMEKSAEYICHNKGDVLEIGFGMGICANYIQSQGVNSHTIIELHPQILERLNAWASGKSNVTIIEGDWANLSLTNTYDGIFLDTFGDDNLDSFKTFALNRIKSGGKITYWNNEPSGNNKYNFDSISHEELLITPDENNYFMSNIYYMPKVES
jgi:spermidine synthase